jgi:hypothetical protein
MSIQRRQENYVVFLATTRRGYESFMTLNARAALWLSAGLLTSDELRHARDRGLNVTDFDYEIAPGDFDTLADAVSTIKEHHPGQAIWIEG